MIVGGNKFAIVFRQLGFAASDSALAAGTRSRFAVVERA